MSERQAVSAKLVTFVQHTDALPGRQPTGNSRSRASMQRTMRPRPVPTVLTRSDCLGLRNPQAAISGDTECPWSASSTT